MIIGYLDFGGTGLGPDEANAIPVVDANAVLTAAVPGQALQSVAGRYAKITQNRGGIELVQLPLSHAPNGRRTDPSRTSSVTPIEDVFGAVIQERNNHNDMIAR